MATPHIAAEKGDFARTVLLPGDPLRSKFIAEHFLENARLVNDVRGVQGYTGTWKGVPVSVQATGMGIPSMGIYAWELCTQFGVENLLRIGTAGAIADDLKLRDVVAVSACCTDSNFSHQFALPGTFAPAADFTLLRTAVEVGEKRGQSLRVGTVLTTDNFYDDGSDGADPWRKMGVLAVEMETAGLYMTAARCGKRALALCTISDHMFRPEKLTSDEREQSVTDMIELALDTAARLG